MAKFKPKKLKRIRKVVNLLQEKLLLHEWEIRLSYYNLQNSHSAKETLAEVESYPESRVAIITFSKSMVGKHKKITNHEWFKAIIHEMMHIRFANTTEGIVYRTRKIHKNPKMFLDEFTAQLEPEVELLAQFIYNEWQGWPKDD